MQINAHPAPSHYKTGERHSQNSVMAKTRTALFLLFSIQFVCSKVYERCELARELRDKHNISERELATWVCIPHYFDIGLVLFFNNQ